jgi:tRNA nucleotidyltransferase/poly(A) polymerase
MIHMSIEVPLPKEAHEVINALKSIEVYVAGGSVRDFLFNFYHHHPFDPKDIDFATPEKPDVVLDLLKRAGIKTLEVGKSFGVVVAVMPESQFEIATFRQESYDGDGRRPDAVKFLTSPEEDARRRDLTINGLFYDPRDKKILDFVAGMADVQNKIIRPIGDAKERYREDRLRVMRTVRFFCRYHRKGLKVGLGQETIEAIKEFSAMDGVSEERVIAEFSAGLKQALYPPHYLECCQELGLFPAMFRGQINEEMVPLASTHDLIVALALLLPENGAAAIKRLNQLKYDNLTSRMVVFLRSLLEFRRDKVYDFWKRRESFQDQERLRDAVMAFSMLVGKDLGEMRRVMDFRPKTSAADFPEMEEGPELGLAIKKAILKEYESLCQ